MLRKIRIIAMSIGCAAVLLGCQEQQVASPPPPKPIVWTTVESADLSQVRRISGVLQPAEEAELSFEVGGKVKNVKVKLGDTVKANQVLAELDSSSFRLTSQSAQGSLQESRAALVEAENEFERKSQLFQNGWVSQAGFDNAKAALERAQSAVKVAEAQLNLTRQDLGDTALRAPYDGKITARLVEPSQTIQPGQTILQITGDDGLEISALVPETIIGNVQDGQIYATQYPALPDVSIEAKVTEIGTRAESANAFPVTLQLQQNPAQLRAGMTAEIDFVFLDQNSAGGSGEVVKVPPTAILPAENQAFFAYVYDSEARVVRQRAIRAANIIDNEILISEGLKPGEIIAIAGIEYLHDGQEVRLLGVGPKQFN